MRSTRMALCDCVAAMLFASALSIPTSGDSEGYTLFVSVDETKVSIVSGNLSVGVTRDWPRIIFWHTSDFLSPTFEVGFPKMHLFNDTDGNGVFSRSEILHTVFMDSNHAAWDFTQVEIDHSLDVGEYVRFGMYSVISAFNMSGEGSPVIADVANVTFWFTVAESRVEHQNSMGTFVIEGKTEMWLSMTVRLINATLSSCLAVESFLQGGASTNMFHVFESDGRNGTATLILSSRTDETTNGLNYTRPLRSTDTPNQYIGYAKEDQTVQAFFIRGSVAAYEANNTTVSRSVPSSCYTTGMGLTLHSVLTLEEGTESISHEGGLGIYEDNFTGRIRDWVKENLPLFTGIVFAVVAASVLAVHLIIRRRRSRGGNAPSEVPGEQRP